MGLSEKKNQVAYNMCMTLCVYVCMCVIVRRDQDEKSLLEDSVAMKFFKSTEKETARKIMVIADKYFEIYFVFCF